MWPLPPCFLQLGTRLGFAFLPGLPVSVVVNCSGLEPPGHLQEIELFNSSGHALLSLPLRPLSNASSGQLWVGSPLRAPPGDFLLKVKGEDAQGHPLHRLSGVTYTSVVPGERSLLSTASPGGSKTPSSTPLLCFPPFLASPKECYMSVCVPNCFQACPR